MVRQLRVVIDALDVGWVDVDRHAAQPRHRVEHRVTRLLGDAVRLAKAQASVRDDQRFGMNGVTDPSSAHRLHALHAFGLACRRRGAFHKRGIDGVHQATPHLDR